MSRLRPRVLALAALLVTPCSLVAPPAAQAFWSHDPNAPTLACSAIRQQQYPVSCSDGAGGMVIVWEDHRDTLTTGVDVYAIRMTGAGTVAPGWTTNGTVICNAAGDQTFPHLVSDGSGGAIVGWRDGRSAPPAIYAQHVLFGGGVDPAWPANGRLVCTAANNRQSPLMISDGAGGAMLGWVDDRDSLAGDYDVVVQHLLANGTVDPAWPASGRVVESTPGSKYFYTSFMSDGVGGALMAWSDYRSGTSWDLYSSHVLANGTLDPAVAANGTPICTLANDQIYQTMCSDGVHGAFLTWSDFRISENDARVYVTRLKQTGIPFAGWPANGLALCPGIASYQYVSEIVPDGATGAIVTWIDLRSAGQGQVYAQHVLQGAAVDGTWPANGVAMSSSPLGTNTESTIPDGAGGAFVTWETYPSDTSFYLDVLSAGHLRAGGTVDPAWPSAGRTFDGVVAVSYDSQIVPDGAGGILLAWMHAHTTGLFNDDIGAARITYDGLLAPEPEIASAQDVPGDQGGKLIVSWNGSWTDTLPGLPVAQYTLWRRLTEAAATQALKSGARAASASALSAPEPGTLRVTREAGQSIYWQFLAAVPAQAFTGYAYEVATDADSSTSGVPWNYYLVDADLKSGAPFYGSAIDSGYSVDNIAPARPAPFTATFAAGTAYLHWGPNFETDLAGYRLYRGSSPSFVPGPSNLVVAQTDTGYTDVAGGPYDYKLSAVDIHGNQSPYAFVQPTGTAGVAPGPPAFALERVGPNPVRGDALRVRFSLPDRAPARLELYDVSGRRAAVREVGDLGAGAHAVDLSAGGAFAPGLYLVRLTRGGETRSTRVAVIE